MVGFLEVDPEHIVIEGPHKAPNDTVVDQIRRRTVFSLKNPTAIDAVYKIKFTAPERAVVRPHSGFIAGLDQVEIIVTAHPEAFTASRSSEKLLINAAKSPISRDKWSEMSPKEVWTMTHKKDIFETKLSVKFKRVEPVSVSSVKAPNPNGQSEGDLAVADDEEKLPTSNPTMDELPPFASAVAYESVNAISTTDSSDDEEEATLKTDSKVNVAKNVIDADDLFEHFQSMSNARSNGLKVVKAKPQRDFEQLTKELQQLKAKMKDSDTNFSLFREKSSRSKDDMLMEVQDLKQSFLEFKACERDRFKAMLNSKLKESESRSLSESEHRFASHVKIEKDEILQVIAKIHRELEDKIRKLTAKIQFVEDRIPSGYASKKDFAELEDKLTLSLQSLSVKVKPLLGEKTTEPDPKHDNLMTVVTFSSCFVAVASLTFAAFLATKK